MVKFAQGEQVRAKFMATKMGPFGTKFLPGVISKVYPDSGKKDDKYTYDINYENGKSEANVKAQFVKEPLAEAASDTAPTPKPVPASEPKQLEPKSVQKEVKAAAAQATTTTPVAKPEPKSAQKASAGPTDATSKMRPTLAEALPDGSDSEVAAKPSKAAASAAASSSKASASASASSSSNKRVRKQVDYHAAEHKNDAMGVSDGDSEEDAAASKQSRAGGSKGKGLKAKKVVADSESEEYEESAEGSGDEESEAEAEAESEPEEVPKKKPAKAATKVAARKPTAKKAVAVSAPPPKKTKKVASSEPDSDSEEESDEDEVDEDDDAFDDEKPPPKTKATKARSAAKAKGGGEWAKQKWTEEEVAELPVLTKPQEMFDEMVAQAEARARTKGSALEGHSLADLAQRLEGRKLRVATMCSGTESPVLALDMISKALFKQCGVQLEMDHVFSCEIEPFKQAYIERNFAPPTLFRDIRELDGEQAT